MNQFLILTTKPSADYELLDSGDGEKLERFGTALLRRPDPQALWQKHLPESEWKKADATFETKWKKERALPEDWKVNLNEKVFRLAVGSFKHVGVFPEQVENWSWIENATSKRAGAKVLNLFGYSGGATLAALRGGADVVHVDGSKVAIGNAKENVALSGLEGKSVRFMLDDALAFVEREIRRGNSYDGIVMDPPAFGRGPEGETWNIEESLPKLLKLLPKVLSANPLFVLINGYASGYSAIAYANCIATLEDEKVLQNGTLEYGELSIEESGSQRLLPAGIFARWSASS